MVPTLQGPVQSDVQTPVRSKRIVVTAVEGVHAGLAQIVGQVAAADVPRLATFLPAVQFPDGRTSGASLIRVTDRAVYYRELILPTSVKTTLAQGDKHGHFNPLQE